MYAPGVLWTAARHKFRLLAVMHNNRGYHREVMHLQRLSNFRNRVASLGGDLGPIGTRIENPDIEYHKLAESMGWWAKGPINDPAQLGPALKEAVAVVRSRHSRLSCAPAIAPCRRTPRPSCRTTTSRTFTLIWRRFRSRRITRAFRCSTSSIESSSCNGRPRATGTHIPDSVVMGPRIREDDSLQIQHQPLALAAGAADHDLGVGGLLLLGQDGVVVLVDAGNHPLLAGAADAELAGIVDVDARIEQHLQDALALGADEFLSRAREFDHEPALLVGPLLGREIFDVDLRARPIRGRRLECLEHRGGSAAIEVCVTWRLGDDRVDVEDFAAVLVVEMEVRMADRFERLQEGHVGARATGIVELPGASELVQALHHAPDRGDTDATGQEHDMAGVLPQREIVARRADLERPADAQLVVHTARAAAACRIALDGDGVA